MITIKTSEEIEILREGGHILAAALKATADAMRVGVKIKELNAIAHEYLVSHGGRPSFLGYGASKKVRGFPSALCVSVNSEIVHGDGTRNTLLQEGDIVGLDLGVQYPLKKGLYTDMAITVGVGKISREAQKLMSVTKDSLTRSIKEVRPGGYVHDISKAIQSFCEAQRFSVIRNLTGHGVGHAVHEDPPIFCYYDSRMPKVELKEGMVICIEPMVALGDWHVVTGKDGWTVRMADGKLGAHFEHTIAVTKTGHEILTI
ncbi:type I methionyl aminopeptidase [Candidatus Uhrbacteria bacterium]|nr:type I methionyl aminopeptidase [Candidatus Uhrbacteria bacterium]